MSTLEVNTIDSVSGTSTLTLGSSNAGTIALGSGDVQSNFLYPAFMATTSGNTNVNESTNVKVTYNTEVLDSNSNYDNSSNYRFTPTVAGKYFCFHSISVQKVGSVSNTKYLFADIYFNGTMKYRSYFDFSNSDGYAANGTVNAIIDFNGSSDYIEAYMQMDTADSAQATILGANYSMFGAYRIGT